MSPGNKLPRFGGASCVSGPHLIEWTYNNKEGFNDSDC
ncbi:hypothetical protein SEA_PERSIMMON_76 [Streptomyces phage Persimmon]|nr:hypothetical protein SEA_PERSIMMON_76 [Streptomyces phage Persimmon]